LINSGLGGCVLGQKHCTQSGREAEDIGQIIMSYLLCVVDRVDMAARHSGMILTAPQTSPD